MLNDKGSKDVRVKVQCIECEGEAEIKMSRLGRARCEYSVDDEGTECNGHLVEIKELSETETET